MRCGIKFVLKHKHSVSAQMPPPNIFRPSRFAATDASNQGTSETLIELEPCTVQTLIELVQSSLDR